MGLLLSEGGPETSCRQAVVRAAKSVKTGVQRRDRITGSGKGFGKGDRVFWVEIGVSQPYWIAESGLVVGFLSLGVSA